MYEFKSTVRQTASDYICISIRRLRLEVRAFEACSKLSLHLLNWGRGHCSDIASVVPGSDKHPNVTVIARGPICSA